MVVLWVFDTLLYNFAHTPEAALAYYSSLPLVIGLQIAFAIKANGMAGKNYLEHG